MTSETVWRVPESIPPPEDFVGFDPCSFRADESFFSYERNLPHWRVEGACYFTTFRLRDSLPKVVVDKMRLEAELWHVRLAKVAALHAGRLPPEEAAAWQEHQRTQMLKLDLLLDEGQGECILRAPDQRFIVAEALLHFEGTRCQMQSFAIMPPNHVHLLCRPLAGYTLEDLCGSWKWFTSQRIKEGLGQKGPLWQSENFDRIIRDAEHFARTVRYIAKNPVKARLREDEATVWFNDAIRHGNGWS